MLKPKLLISLLLATAMFSLFAATASAAEKTSAVTTLDACGYFIGLQTASHTDNDMANGVTYTTEHGTWTGVTNNYFQTPVASLGPVKGAYDDTHSKDAAGNIAGTERFISSAGKINQVYARTNGVWNVSVIATGELSFLTSNTNGHCYTGLFPRP